MTNHLMSRHFAPATRAIGRDLKQTLPQLLSVLLIVKALHSSTPQQQTILTLCVLCVLCASVVGQWLNKYSPQRHREHKGRTEKEPGPLCKIIEKGASSKFTFALTKKVGARGCRCRRSLHKKACRQSLQDTQRLLTVQRFHQVIRPHRPASHPAHLSHRPASN